MTDDIPDPEQWVNDNRDVLVDVIKHSADDFTRALALAFLTRHGGEPEIDQLERELEAAKEVV